MFQTEKRWIARSLSIVPLFVLLVVACQSAGSNGFATDGDVPHVTYSQIDVSAEIVPGITNGRITANDLALATSPMDIWDGGADLVWPLTADNITLVSTSALDTALGDGAQTIQVIGLDINFDLLVEVIALAGTTPVTTVGEFIRLNQLVVVSVGLYNGGNQGLITATHDSVNSDQAFIQILKGISQKSHFTIPAGFFIVFQNVTIGSDSSKVATYEFLARANTTIPPVAPFFAILEPVTLAGVAATTEMRILNGRAVPAKTDVWVQGSANAPGGFVSLGIDFLLFDEDEVVGLSAFRACEIGC